MNLEAKKDHQDPPPPHYKTEDPRKRLKRAIQRRLGEVGESQRWLAGKVGTTDTMLSLYLSGKGGLSRPRLELIVDVLGLPKTVLPQE